MRGDISKFAGAEIAENGEVRTREFGFLKTAK